MIIFLSLYFISLTSPVFTAPTAATCQSRFVSSPPSNSPSVYFNTSHIGVSLISPTDPRFDDLRRHANTLDLNSDASYIALPKSASKVVSILQAAISSDIRPTVRSGGHCYEDFWTNNTAGVLIDLSGLDGIYQSQFNSILWIDPGVKLEKAYIKLMYDFNATFPGGACLDVAVGGLVLGGGYGHFARKMGLAIDYVCAMEIAIVTAERRVRLINVGRNSTGKEKDLFWALLGAGQQQFGVVTKIGFCNLPDMPGRVHKYEGSWSLGNDKEMGEEKFMDFIEKYSKFLVAHSAVDSEYCDLYTEMVVGKSGNSSYIWIRILLIGDRKELMSNYISAVGLDEGKFSCEVMSGLRATMAGSYRNSLGSDGDYYVRRSAYMVGPMPLHQRQALWNYTTNMDTGYISSAMVQMSSYGCAVSKVTENSTAYPHRKAVMKIQYIITWKNSEDTPAHKEWSDDFYRGMYGPNGPVPDDVMDGCYVGYPDGQLVNPQYLYYKGNYEKLKTVKKEWDPLNIFHYKQSIQINS